MDVIRNIVLSVAFFFSIWIGIVYIQIGNPSEMSEWAYEVVSLKENYAHSIDGRKIVIVAGSNALLGINSKMIEDRFNIPVVNDAVNGGFGMPYILYQSKKVLKKGDIAILPLEYQMYQLGDEPGIPYIDYIISRDPEYFSTLNTIEKLKVIMGISFKRTFQGIISPFHQLKKTFGIYGIQNVNARGDQINIESSKMTSKQRKELDTFRASKIDSSDLSDGFIHYMDDYISWARSHGIKLIFMPPCHMAFNYYKTEKYVKFLGNIKKYYQDANVLYLGKPEDYMYEKKYHYNSVYHLNDIGVTKRTNQIIMDITQKLHGDHSLLKPHRSGIDINTAGASTLSASMHADAARKGRQNVWEIFVSRILGGDGDESSYSC